MRKSNMIAGTVALLLCAASCSHDKLPVYEDVSRLHFYWATAAANEDTKDRATINLGYDNPVKADSTIKIKVKLLGRVAGEDRPITAEIIRAESSAVLGEDIEFLPSFLPKGAATGFLQVKILNTEKLKTEALVARIRLTPNAAFYVDYSPKTGLEYNIEFNAKADAPNLWVALLAQHEQMWGKWSKAKERVICEGLNVTRAFFEYDPATENPTTVFNMRYNTSNNQYSIGMVGIVNRLLKTYKEGEVDLDGNPKPKDEELKDENGEVIKLGLPTVI